MIECEMTPDQIAEAQRMAANGWQSTSSEGCGANLS
jgi:hypothetical protein